MNEDFKVIKLYEESASADSTLWNDFRGGNLPAFDALFKKFVNTLFQYGCRITSDPDLVNECIQDLFVELWEKRDLLGEVQFVKQYLLKTFSRKITQVLITKKRYEPVSGLDKFNFEMVLSYEQNLIEEESMTEQSLQLHKAIEALSERQRQALYLKYFENMKYTDIAGIMEITVESVYKIVCKAISILKNQLHSIILLYSLIEAVL